MATAKPVYIHKIIGDCVARTETVLLPALSLYDPNIVGINYLFGPYKEIFNTLVEMTQADLTSVKKYPLVWFWMPNKIQHGKTVGLDGVDPIRIIIARWGNNTDKTPQRYENNFEPVLYPIYLELMNQLYLDPRIVSDGTGLIPHSQTDWPYWGGEFTDPEVANVLSDYVDAIELNNIEINLLLKKC